VIAMNTVYHRDQHHREQFTTIFTDGAPMQIEIGIDNALKRLNGSRIEAVKADIIGLGDSRILASSGFVPYDSDAKEPVSRQGFYRHVAGVAHAALKRR